MRIERHDLTSTGAGTHRGAGSPTPSRRVPAPRAATVLPAPRGGMPRPGHSAPAHRAARQGAQPHRRPPHLAEAFDPRDNAIGVLRLALVAVVAVAHGVQIAAGRAPVIGSAGVGELAVDALFVLSGFLAARSYLRLGSLRRFAWHRFLRIVPGFWACLLLTALVVAPLVALLSGRPLLPLLTGPDSAASYLGANALLSIQQPGIAGLPAAGHEPGVLTGPLTTLAAGALCCALLAALGALGLLRRRIRLVAGLTGGLWVLTALAAAGFPLLASGAALRLPLVFLLGALAWLLARHIPVSGVLAAACVAALSAGTHLLPDYRALAAPALAYLLLWLAVRLPLRSSPSWDASYGLYLYHWPVQQVLVLLGATSLTLPGFLAFSLGVALLLAGASWALVERPALAGRGAAWVEFHLPGTARPQPQPHIRRQEPAAAPARRARPPRRTGESARTRLARARSGEYVGRHAAPQPPDA
ncbi:peptidoglycan/LPS O-acetylase OafA/YrhL [Kineococcus xinjiangensis]|uniref:Peptidoglycan/LPS O-acetylase OafA/YrhL n=1 Tax=Kineococcus xinjiangensis TaxID=512762 RepID=A0A2S6IDQ6_9ACTN|nr:acyltransferase [Kineococcus xinjiangensis]PPK92354.1 peptidoglycan/LPS O-acetylase OafA/YrhL [Kineococcus xinjiangensis]